MRNRIIEARIICNQEITSGIYRMILDCADREKIKKTCSTSARAAEPGQFVNLYLRDKSMLLPRPISICLSENNRITLIYRIAGKGTEVLSSYQEGEALQISTPLGQGYRIEAIFDALLGVASARKTIALVAGGLGIPPMLELARVIRERIGTDGQIRLIAILGFRETSFLTEELEVYCDAVHTATENGSEGFHGSVLELMDAKGITADYYLSCGPKPMLKALAGICSYLEKPLQVSLEERMGCGYGACVGCTCRTKETINGHTTVAQKKVCKDGPVFFGKEVIWDA